MWLWREWMSLVFNIYTTVFYLCSLNVSPHFLYPCMCMLQFTDRPHKLTHFQYTAWPDHGVPLHPSSLVKFVQEVRKVHGNSPAPMVLHCRWGRDACVHSTYVVWGIMVHCHIGYRMHDSTLSHHVWMRLHVSYTEQGRFACFYYNMPCIRMHTYVYLYSALVEWKLVMYYTVYMPWHLT